MFKKSLFICLLLSTCIANADIYKCVVDGNTIFTQQPCSANAEKLEIKVHQPSEEDNRF